MIVFWLTSICMLLLALFIVLVPLVRQHKKTTVIPRNKLNISIHREHLTELENELKAGNLGRKDFENAVQELEQELLQNVAIDDEKKSIDFPKRSTWTALLITVLLPVFVVGLYLRLGDVDMINAQSNANPQQSANGEMHSIDEMVERLSNRLQSEPDDAQGWRMLARSYVVLERFNDAVIAYRKAHELIGDDPDLLADFSEALLLSNNSRFTNETLELLTLTLKANPDQPKALWIAGFGAFENGDYSKALQYWERLLKLLPPGDEQVNTLQEHINQVKHAMGATTEGESIISLNEEHSDAFTNQATSTVVAVDVSLDSSLIGNAKSDDTVFIFARAAQGSPMPLAILRKQVKDLPLKTTLDDSMAMSPAMKLSSFNEVIIGARVSRSGNAMPQSGDLQGLSNTVILDEVTGVKIIIDQVLP
jgi:cytochrome c-type biogenesis protein CcmH